LTILQRSTAECGLPCITGNDREQMASRDLNSAPSIVVIRAKPQILATDWQSRLRAAPLSAWLMVAALLSFGAVRDPHLAGWLISPAVAIVLLAVPSAIGRLNARVRITEEAVEYRGFFRVPRRIERSNLDRVVRLRLLVLGSHFAFTRLLFLDGSGRARLSMQAEWFAEADLDRVKSDLLVAWSDSNEGLSPRSANRLYPGAASWALIHRYELIGVGAVVVLLAIGLLSEGRTS
jgi:hypothetical protein